MLNKKLLTPWDCSPIFWSSIALTHLIFWKVLILIWTLSPYCFYLYTLCPVSLTVELKRTYPSLNKKHFCEVWFVIFYSKGKREPDCWYILSMVKTLNHFKGGNLIFYSWDYQLNWTHVFGVPTVFKDGRSLSEQPLQEFLWKATLGTPAWWVWMFSDGQLSAPPWFYHSIVDLWPF